MGLVNKIGMTFLLRNVNRFKFGHPPNGVLSLDYRPCGQRARLLCPTVRCCGWHPRRNRLASWTRVPINNINDYYYYYGYRFSFPSRLALLEFYPAGPPKCITQYFELPRIARPPVAGILMFPL